MNEEAAIEQRLRRSVGPDSEDVPQHVLHRLQRDQAYRMVEEMHRHIGEHHQAGKKPQSTDHGKNRSRRDRSIKPLATDVPFLYPGAPRQHKDEPPSEDARVCWRSDISSNRSARWWPSTMSLSRYRKARGW